MPRLSHVISGITRRHRSAYRGYDVNTISTPSPPSSSSSPDASQASEREAATSNTSGCSSEVPEMQACLGTFDLVSLGVGSCLGTGMYLTAGIVASTLAGPGGVVSFIVAGVASMLTGLCYAELASLCPKSSGSAYMYAYVTAGELVAFVIGWGLVVEYVIGTAAGAAALSETLDSMCGGFFSAYTKSAAAWMSLPKLDLVAAAICAVLTLLLMSGAEMSAKVNNLLNLCNLLVLVLFVVASLCLGSVVNWKTGGFFPMGLSGVVGAIPTCYFAFIGFDALAATGAEARNPSRTIPVSILLSILLSAVAYVVVILTLTFDLPFYLLPSHTAMTDVFPQLNFTPGKYVVAIGAVSGEFAATFGSLFPLPRVLMAMASDGLLFRQLGAICPKRHTPVTATLFSGLVAIVMATFFRLTILIELVLIGTLLAYVLVTFALLHMRYVVLEKPPPLSGHLQHDSGWSEAQAATCPGEESANLGTSAFSGSLKASAGRTAEKEGYAELGKTSKRNYHPQRVVENEIEATCKESFSQESSHTRTFYQGNRTPSKQPAMSRFSSSSFRGRGSGSHHFNETPSFAEESPRGEDYEGTGSSGEERGTAKFLDKSSHSRSAGRGSLFSRWLSFRHRRPEVNSHEYHPLLDMGAEEELADSEDVLYDKRVAVRALQPPMNQPGVSCPHSVTCSSENVSHPHSRLPQLAGDCRRSLGGKGTLPLWLKVVNDVVGYVSATSFRVEALLYAIYGAEIVLSLSVSQMWRSMADGSWVSLGILGVLSAILVVLVGVLTFLPESVEGNSFRAPLVPSLPVFVAMVNIFLMTSLSAATWLLFALWMSAGLLVYVLYGFSHSKAVTTTTTTTTTTTMTSASIPTTAGAVCPTPVTILLDEEEEEEDVGEEAEEGQEGERVSLLRR